MPFEYPLMVPPFPTKQRYLMNAQEAQQHFTWFVSQSQARRELLVKAVNTTGRTKEKWKLDFTPGSLITLWTWGQRQFQSRSLTPQELAADLETRPDWYKKIKRYDRVLTTGTQQLVLDVGFYLAEVFMRLYSQVHWALWGTECFPENEPYLTGFRYPFVPYQLVSACAWFFLKAKDTSTLRRPRTFRNDVSPMLLYNKYKHWVGNLGPLIGSDSSIPA